MYIFIMSNDNDQLNKENNLFLLIKKQIDDYISVLQENEKDFNELKNNNIIIDVEKENNNNQLLNFFSTISKSLYSSTLYEIFTKEEVTIISNRIKCSNVYKNNCQCKEYQKIK